MKEHVNELSGLVNEYVKVNVHGPESREGILLGITSEYLGIQTKEGDIIYYQLQHVKSLTLKNQSSNFARKDADFIKAASFKDLLKEFKKSWVKINRAKPEKAEGFLSKVTNEYVVLINDGDVILISIHHIKTINELFEDDNNNDNDNNNNEQQKEDSKQSNYNSNKKVNFLFDNKNLFKL